jgi:hypothetical protein
MIMWKKKFLINSNYFVFCFFSLILVFGWNILQDYGVTIDDYFYYINAENTYIYAKKLLFSLFYGDTNLLQLKSKLNEHPVIFELLLVVATKLLNINEINKIYLLAHKLNFFIFFLSLVTFYNLIQKRFKKIYFSLLSVVFFLLSPRIFAEAFYNSRDIFFLSIFIFYLNSLISYLDNKNTQNTIFFAFFTALLINSKILGLIPFGLFCIFYIYNFVNTKKKLFKERNNLLLFLFFTLFFIYILWPFLWDNPIKNLFFAFKNILERHEEIILVNYYFGNYISSDIMPWHYRIVWFLITTPVIIIFLFIGGLIFILEKLPKLLSLSLNSNFEIDNENFIDILLLLIFLCSFFIAVEFNKSQFGGWRHLYYLYPITIYFVIFFLNFLKKKFFYNFLIFILIFFNLSYNLYWSIKYHPHQYVFFNFISKNYAFKNFDLDWWGISHKSALKFILSESKKEKINVFAEGFTSLKDSYLFLNDNEKKRIMISNFENADYIIDIKMKRLRANNDILNSDFKLISEIIVNNQPISSIYKKLKNK